MPVRLRLLFIQEKAKRGQKGTGFSVSIRYSRRLISVRFFQNRASAFARLCLAVATRFSLGGIRFYRSISFGDFRSAGKVSPIAAIRDILFSLMKKIFLSLTLVFTFAAASFAQTEKQKMKFAGEIKEVMTRQTAAWNRGDIDGFMQGYWKSENLVFVSGANVTKGWQPTLDRYKKNYDSRAKMGGLTFSDLEVEVLSKDSAVVLGSWSLKRENDSPGGKFTLVFRRFKDGWKIVHDHTS